MPEDIRLIISVDRLNEYREKQPTWKAWFLVHCTILITVRNVVAAR